MEKYKYCSITETTFGDGKRVLVYGCIKSVGVMLERLLQWHMWDIGLGNLLGTFQWTV